MLSVFGDMLGAAIAGQLTGFAGDMLGIGMTNDANLQAVRETNQANTANVKATNEANLEQVRLTNAANAEQANLAYQRSLPVNQVRDLMDAGMSKAGALTKLAGGGVYTPPALQAGTSQVATEQTPHFDYSGIAKAAERIANIPANAVQLEYNKEQLNALRNELQMKRDAESRAQQKHEYDMWKEKYGKEAATILDAVSSRVSDLLLQSGKEISDFKSFESLIRGLNLQDDKDIKRLPHIARTQLYESVSQKFADERARQQQDNQNRASYDAHQLSILERALKNVDLKYYDKEKHEQLLNLMRVGQGLIEENNIKFQDRTAKEMENYVRESGIENEAQARALAEYVRKLEQEDELDIQNRRTTANKYTFGVHNQFRVVLRDLGELLMKVKF